MENFKILTNIPVPRAPKKISSANGSIKGPHKEGTYPWHFMEVSDALCVGDYEPKKMTNILTIANHSWTAMHMGYKFCARTIDNQIYIFRIK